MVESDQAGRWEMQSKDSSLRRLGSMISGVSWTDGGCPRGDEWSEPSWMWLLALEEVGGRKEAFKPDGKIQTAPDTTSVWWSEGRQES